MNNSLASSMIRRFRDAILLNATLAFAYHTLVLACRYIEARFQVGREPPNTALATDLLCEGCTT